MTPGFAICCLTRSSSICVIGGKPLPMPAYFLSRSTAAARRADGV
jgi:hypothetical protein